MKKPIYLSLLLLSLFLAMTGYSQSEIKCYTFSKNENGQIENVFVTLSINGKNVETQVKKYFKSEGNITQNENMRLATLVDGKIVFASSEDKKASDLEKKKDEVWTIKGDLLIIEGYTLKLSACN